MSRFGILNYDKGQLTVAGAVKVTALQDKEFRLAVIFVEAAGKPQTAEDLALKSDGAFDAQEVPEVFANMIKTIRADQELGNILKLHQYFGFEAGFYHGYSEKNPEMPGHPKDAEASSRRLTGEDRKSRVDEAMAAARARIAEKEAADAAALRNLRPARVEHGRSGGGGRQP